MAAPMYAGPMDFEQTRFGLGPGVGGYDAGLPKYTASMLVPTPQNIVSIINAADANGVLVFIRLTGPRTRWAPVNASGCAIYDETLYKAELQKYTPTSQGGLLSQADFDALSSAFARRRFIAYINDEPNLGIYCNSITQQHVNNMGLAHKAIWPGVLTAIRIQADQLTQQLSLGGFDGNYSGLDYTWFQYNRAAAINTRTPAEDFAYQKSLSAGINTGMIPGMNWPDGGDGRLWDCQNNGTSSCNIAGNTGSPKWLASPQEIKDVADAASTDPDAPAFVWWTTTNDCTGNSWCAFAQYENRSDYVAAWDYSLNKFNSRPTFNGFRQAKGTVVQPPPVGETPLKVITQVSGSGDTIAVPAHQAGDLILYYSWNRISGVTPGLATGYTNITATTSGVVGQRAGWFYDSGNTAAQIVSTNATGIFVAVIRGSLASGPVGNRALAGLTASTGIIYNDVTMNVVDGTSLIFGAAVHSTATNVNLPPSGMNNILTAAGAAMHVTPAGVTSWAQQTVTVNATGDWRSLTVEIVADPGQVATPQPPTLPLLADRTIPELSTLTFTVTASDPDTQQANLTYSVTSGPGAINNSGVYSYTPDANAAASSPYTVTIRVCDDTSPTPLCDSKSFTLTVTDTSVIGSGVSLVGSAATAGTSGTVPAHAIGDLIVITAYNSLNGTIPTLAAGYTGIQAGSTGSGGTMALRTAYRVATATNDASGTWTNATSVQVDVYHNVNQASPIGGSSGTQSLSDSQMTYPAVTMQVTDGSSWVYGAGIHTTATNVNAAPSGLTARTSLDHAATFDTNGPVVTFPSRSVAVNATGQRRNHTVEIKADPATTGQPPVLGAIGNKSVQEQQTLAFPATATDVDTAVENLTYTLDAGAPAWATISTGGNFVATPPAGTAAGSPYSVTVRVSDGTHEDFETISITVTAPVTFPFLRGGGLGSLKQRSSQGSNSAA